MALTNNDNNDNNSSNSSRSGEYVSGDHEESGEDASAPADDVIEHLIASVRGEGVQQSDTQVQRHTQEPALAAQLHALHHKRNESIRTHIVVPVTQTLKI